MASYKYVHDYDNEKGFAKCIISATQTMLT